MRAKAIAGILALGAVALLAVPSGASARPGFYKVPASTSAEMFVRLSHRQLVVIAALRGRALLFDLKTTTDGSVSVTYERPFGRVEGGALRFGLGRAGEVDLRFVASKTEEQRPPAGCRGGPTTSTEGRFVGRVSFHPPGKFVAVDLRRATGVVGHQSALVCRRRSPRGEPATPHVDETRRLIAGDPGGRRRFYATTVPSFTKSETETTRFDATVTRKVGPLTIFDSASAGGRPDSSTFAVPDLDDLPATATVEPAAPFSGSATFELPSRRTATVSGDLAVELPELGKVPLVGPKIAAGLCRGVSCTGSLPRSLRPEPSAGGLSVSIVSSRGHADGRALDASLLAPLLR